MVWYLIGHVHVHVSVVNHTHFKLYYLLEWLIALLQALIFSYTLFYELIKLL